MFTFNKCWYIALFGGFFMTLLTLGCASVPNWLKNCEQKVKYNLVQPDTASGRDCADLASNDWRSCKDYAIHPKDECLRNSQRWANEEYHRKLDQYHENMTRCEREYYEALQRWKYQKNKNPYNEPKRYFHCGGYQQPDFNDILEQNEKKCVEKYDFDMKKCCKTYLNRVVKCGGRIN